MDQTLIRLRRPPSGRRRIALASALLITAALVVPLSAGVSQAAGSGTAGQITIGGLCMDDANQGTANGNPIEIYTCNSGSNQSFTWQANGSVTVLGKCVDITGGSDANGALLDLYTCNSSPEQQFSWLPDGTIYSPMSSKCLQVQGGSIASGAQIGLEPCDPAVNLQDWIASTAPASQYSLTAAPIVNGGFSGSDSPSMPFIDQNGQFYYQNSYSGYSAGNNRDWNFYTGSNYSTATLAPISNAVNPNNSQDSNANTTWRCNNSPTGLGATTVPGGYPEQNYCDLVGVWVDPDTGNWYGLVHNEFSMSPFADSAHYDAIDYAVSTNQGATWTIEGHAITSPYATIRGNGQLFTLNTNGTLTTLGKCLDISGGGTAAGTAVDTYSCGNNQANQQWTYKNGTLINPASALCLTAANTTSGSTFTINTCNGSAAQQFTAPASGATGQITLTSQSTLCIDGDNTPELYACNDPSANGNTQFPNQTYYWGDGDPRLFPDYASGYFYVFYTSRLVDKNGGWGAFEEHVARSPIADKMAPSSWEKWNNGSWSTPGVGGAESDVIPANGAGTGYIASGQGYSPSSTGTLETQVANGSAPPTSELSFMNISWDAYLGMYIGTPENEFDTNGETGAPQHIYATADLATENWVDLGPIGDPQSSWYRWLVDPVNLTSDLVLGKTFGLYCNISCEDGSGGGSVSVTIAPTSSSPLPTPPVASGADYQIDAGSGEYLVQSGSTLTTSNASSTSAAQLWSFASTGDGFYTIANAATGQALGVDDTSNAGRAWDSGVSVSTLGSTAAVGQEWSIQSVVQSPATSGSSTPTGTYRLINRYSGLALSLTGGTQAVATAPQRTWNTNTTTGDTRPANAQILTFTAGAPPVNLNGTHTVSLSGQALDDPNWSTGNGTQLDTWQLNGGTNQNWVFTQQPNGSYTVANAYSNLCMDDNGGFTTPGTTVIQWPCSGGNNQDWTVTKQSNGSYEITNVNSGLLLTTSTATSGGEVTQQSNTSSALQQWTIN